MYNILYINQNTQEVIQVGTTSVNPTINKINNNNEVIHYERLYLDKTKQMCKLMVGKYTFDKSTSGQTITSLYNLLVCVLL